MDEELRAIERRADQGDPIARERLERLRARAGVEASSADVLETLVEVERALDDAQGTFARSGLADFHAYVDALFAREPGLHALRIRGYTPGFIDGDLCEHSQSTRIRSGDDGDDEDGDAGATRNDVPEDRAREYSRALGEFKPVLHAEHGTDWELTLRRGPRGVQATTAPWSCGY